MTIAFILLFRPVYAAVFGEEDSSRLRRRVIPNLVIVLTQVVFWAALIVTLSIVLHRG